MIRLQAEPLNSERFWHLIYGDKDEWRSKPYDFLLDMPYLLRGKLVCDIGCGLGDGLAMLATHFPHSQLYGIDFYAPAIEKAKKKHVGIRFDVGDIRDCSLPIVNTMLIIQTLEHIEDPMDAVDRCLDHCQRLIITVPTAGTNLAKDQSHLYEFEEKDFDKYGPIAVRYLTGNKTMFTLKGRI